MTVYVLAVTNGVHHVNRYASTDLERVIAESSVIAKSFDSQWKEVSHLTSRRNGKWMEVRRWDMTKGNAVFSIEEWTTS